MYCSADCQKKHWKTHKMLCKTPAERAALRAVEDEAVRRQLCHRRLMSACAKGDCKIIKEVLEKGADPNYQEHMDECVTPLILAAEEGRVEAVKILLAHGANVNWVAKDGAFAMYLASQNGHKEVIDLLIAAGADVNCARNATFTPILLASVQGHISVLKTLIAAGGDATFVGRDGSTCLTEAVERNQPEAVGILLAAGANANHAKPDGKTSLWFASMHGMIEVARALLDGGADPLINNCLDIARQFNHPAIAALIEDKIEHPHQQPPALSPISPIGNVLRS